jgi:Ser/Thr protein kinase RdoA (MazF antagonist)
MVSDHLLGLAAAVYGFDAATLGFVSVTTNDIYRFRKDGQPYILRCARRRAKDIRQTIAEMDWLDYLSRCGVSVSLPLRTRSGKLAVAVEDDGKSYILAAFSMASGCFWDRNDPSRWNATIFHNWGKVMGDMHRLTKEYVPANDQDIRNRFAERETLNDSVRACPSVNSIAEEIMSQIMGLPAGADSYGLIHYDLHPWNFYIAGERINVFDFDDCLYGWFALDMGVALYHGLWWGRHDDARPVPHDFTRSIITNFIAGYLSSNALSGFWLAQIPLFMRYRQICKFSWFFDPHHIDAEQRARIRNIEDGVLFTGCELDAALFAIDTYQ